MSFQSIWEDLRKRGVQTARYPYDKVISFVMRYYPKDKNKQDVNILEVGCGAGNNLWALALEGFNVYGIDGSEAAINIAKEIFNKFGVKGEFIVGDFTERFPFKEGYFDLVIDRGSITCVDYEDAKRTINEVHRVLKEGGYFFFNPYSKMHTSYISSKTRINDNFVLTEAGSIVGTGYVCFYDREDVIKLLDRFEIIELKELTLKDNIDGNIHGEWEVVCRKI